MDKENRNAAITITITIMILASLGSFKRSNIQNYFENRHFTKKAEQIEKKNVSFLNNLDKSDQMIGTDLNNNLIRDDIDAFIKTNLRDKAAIEVATVYSHHVEYTIAAYNKNVSETNRQKVKGTLEVIQSIEDSIDHVAKMNRKYAKNLSQERPYAIDDFILLRQTLVKHKNKIFINNPRKTLAYEYLLLEYPPKPLKPINKLNEEDYKARINKILATLIYCEEVSQEIQEKAIKNQIKDKP